MTNPPDSMPLPTEIAFRRSPLFSKRLLLLFGGIALGGVLGILSVPQNIIGNPGFQKFMVVYLLLATVFFLWRHIALHRKGGTPPLRFGEDSAELPVHVNSGRIRVIPYADIFSATLRGRASRPVLIIDTRKRVFAYPVREFESPDAANAIMEILRRRIAARHDGAAQWESMEKRAAAAAVLGGFKPWGTWGLIALLAVVFALELLLAPGDDLFGIMDMGANASLLVWQGEWFRLVTANLLHANLLHLLSNALFAFIIGAVVEHQLGTRRYIILVLATGILSQFASALWIHLGWFSSGVLFSVGISGALFGMLGAQAVLNRRFAGQLPGGYRFTPRVWWILLGLNFIFVPLTTPEVDTAAHFGGLISGIAVGWLLCRGQVLVTQQPRPGLIMNGALAGLAALWLAGIAVAVHNAVDPVARQAEHAALIHILLESSSPDPEIDNSAAWSIATEPAPTKEELTNAFTLVNRSLATMRARYQNHRGETFHIRDTLATIYYRMGDFDTAISLEENLNSYDAVTQSQLGRFMFANWRAHGVRSIGPTPLAALQTPPATPQITLNPELSGDSATFNIKLPESLPNGAQIYAVLWKGDALQGVLRINFRPNPSSTYFQTMIIPGPAKLFVSSGADMPELSVVSIDMSNCHCQGMSGDHNVQFFPMDGDIAKLP